MKKGGLIMLKNIQLNNIENVAQQLLDNISQIQSIKTLENIYSLDKHVINQYNANDYITKTTELFKKVVVNQQTDIITYGEIIHSQKIITKVLNYYLNELHKQLPNTINLTNLTDQQAKFFNVNNTTDITLNKMKIKNNKLFVNKVAIATMPLHNEQVVADAIDGNQIVNANISIYEVNIKQYVQAVIMPYLMLIYTANNDDKTPKIVHSNTEIFMDQIDNFIADLKVETKTTLRIVNDNLNEQNALTQQRMSTTITKYNEIINNANKYVSTKTIYI